MLGLTTRVGTATGVVGAVGLAVLLLGTTVWPATGEGAESTTSESLTDADTVEFDGRLYANPETGCIDLPPDDWNSADVIPVEPRPSPRADDTNGERVDELLEGQRVPLLQGDTYVHAEPWPACDEPPTATPVRGRADADR